MSDASRPNPYGSGSLKAMARQGLAELRNVLYQGYGSQVDPGVWGSPSYDEIRRDRRTSAPERKSLLASALDDAANRLRDVPSSERRSEDGREL